MKYLYLFIISLSLLGCSSPVGQNIFNAQGEMAGEVTMHGAILQSRLTASDTLVEGDLPGLKGLARFEISGTRDFEIPLRTKWLEALPENDFIVKANVNDLKPGSRYYYRLTYGRDTVRVKTGNINQFTTLGGATSDSPASFVVVTGMNYSFFYHGPKNDGQGAYQGPDRPLGFPALESIHKINPDFITFTGDNVYYDHPKELSASDIADMRKKWHEQFFQPRVKELFSKIPAYWEKDDHDHRYNDSDTTSARQPSHALGVKTFKEQVPVTSPGEQNAVTYRTHRINKHLQIWLVEGRDYRSPNEMEDGPEKTLWGAKQKEWLKTTLLESDAAFKILISPTPMIGPDDAYKIDNHTNPDGFQHEGKEFLQWLSENGLPNEGFYIICGDRHWQYHSIHPAGVEEFSCGALVDANSRAGRLPGDPKSSDPEALLTVPYIQGKGEESGGFLEVKVESEKDTVMASFNFYDENGKLLYSTVKKR